MTIYRVRLQYDVNPSNPRTDDGGNLGTMVCWHRRYTLGDEQPSCHPDDYRHGLACEYDEDIPEDLELTQAGEVSWARQEVRNAVQVLRLYGRSANGTARMREAWAEYRRCMSSKYRTPAARVALALANHYVALPLYLYDHSGITISTTPFSDQWDSGQVGFIYADKAKARETCGRDLTDEEIADVLRAEVTTYDQYLTGDIYRFEIEREVPFKKVYDDGREVEDAEWHYVDSCGGFYGSDPVKSGMTGHVNKALHDALVSASHDVGEWMEVEVADAPTEETEPA